MLKNIRTRICRNSNLYPIVVLFLTLILMACEAKPTDVATLQVRTKTPTLSPSMTPSSAPLLLTPQLTKEPGLDIEKVVFSPNGKMLAYYFFASQLTVKLWDVEKRQDVNTLTGHTAKVTCIAFSPDGKILASGSENGVVILWEVETGKKLTSLKNEVQKYIYSIAFSPDGKTLASIGWGAEGSYLMLWNVENGQASQTLKDDRYRYNIENIAFSPDGSMLALGSSLGAKVWDLESGQELRSLTVEPVCFADACGGELGVTDVVFSSDSKTLMILNQADEIIMFWDVDGSVLKTLRSDRWTKVAYSTDSKYLASLENIYGDYGLTKSIHLYNVETLQEIISIDTTAYIYNFVFSPNGEYFVWLEQADKVQRMRLYDVQTLQEIRIFEMEEYSYAFAFSPDSKVLAIGGSDGEIQLLDVAP